jgi:hypothetical protein
MFSDFQVCPVEVQIFSSPVTVFLAMHYFLGHQLFSCLLYDDIVITDNIPELCLTYKKFHVYVT